MEGSFVMDRRKAELNPFESPLDDPWDGTIGVSESQDEGYLAQKEFCRKKGAPMFIPYDGMCWRCGRNIFGVDGISVEAAGKYLITGCPYCHASYCD